MEAMSGICRVPYPFLPLFFFLSPFIPVIVQLELLERWVDDDNSRNAFRTHS